jgi:hypothetical protein
MGYTGDLANANRSGPQACKAASGVEEGAYGR